MKAVKIPRKLKKALKQACLSEISKVWKAKDIKIYSIRIKFSERDKMMPTFRNKVVSAYKLG